MRYYDLGADGRVLRSYAVPQVGKTLHYLSEPPDSTQWMRDGVPGENWIPDQAVIDAIAAEEARIAAKAQAIIDNLLSWQQVSDAIDGATTIAAIKVIIKKMARIVYWLAKDRAD